MHGSQERKTIFSGQFHQFDEAYIKNVSRAGAFMGPGPGGLNLRSEVICQKPSSIKTTFAQSKRDTSQEREAAQRPGPSSYKITHRTPKHAVKFTEGERVIDFLKF